jgi:hypothetical protein
MFKAILQCISAGQEDDVAVPAETKWSDKAEKGPDTTPDAVLAQKIIAAMRDAEKTGEELRMNVSDVVQINGWTESLAKAVLARLDDGIKVCSESLFARFHLSPRVEIFVSALRTSTRSEPVADTSSSTFLRLIADADVRAGHARMAWH